MGVRVEEAVHEDLFEIGVEDLFYQPFTIELLQRERTDVCDLGAFHIVHGQHARGAVARHRARYDDQFELAKIGCQPREVRGFLAVVQLDDE